MARLKPTVELTEDETGAVLLDMRRGVYWHLNVVGVSVARALADESTVAGIARGIAEEFDVDTATAERDVRDLLVQLRRARLLDGRVS